MDKVILRAIKRFFGLERSLPNILKKFDSIHGQLSSYVAEQEEVVKANKERISKLNEENNARTAEARRASAVVDRIKGFTSFGPEDAVLKK